ncbi:MAG: glycosyltransferase family 2 protein [Acholeplasma sp.]|nr:glycosyltransferase family 2 protein [Acholeplasma sp.]
MIDMIKKKFTFVILTYNHEDFVCDHLNSIKYQITSFGIGMSFDLIIADDNSTDKTQCIIDQWIIKNKSLFNRIKLLYNQQRRGTCYNFSNAIKNVQTEIFNCLDGDDLYTWNNIFPIFDYFDNYDVVYTPILKFKDLVSGWNKNSFYTSLADVKFYEYNKAKWSKYYVSPPFSCGHFFKKSLFTESLLSFIEKFDLIEDRAMWIKLFEENPSLKIKLLNNFQILYRVNNSSVMHTINSDIRIAYSFDSIKQHKFVYDLVTNKKIMRFHFRRATRELKNIFKLRRPRTNLINIFIHKIQVYTFVISNRKITSKMKLNSFNAEYNNFIAFIKEQTDV